MNFLLFVHSFSNNIVDIVNVTPKLSLRRSRLGDGLSVNVYLSVNLTKINSWG